MNPSNGFEDCRVGGRPPAEICRRQLETLPGASVSRSRRRRVLEILLRAPELKARSLIHADLIPENVIVRDGALFLVDWEYAGFGNPLVDLAMVAVHFGLSEEQWQAFLAAYGGVEPDVVTRLMPAIAAREPYGVKRKSTSRGSRVISRPTRDCAGTGSR